MTGDQADGSEQHNKRAEDPQGSKTTSSSYKEIVVVPGDTLWGIARKNLGQGASNRDIAMQVKTIVSLNKIENPDLIYPGEKFLIPHEQPSETERT